MDSFWLRQSWLLLAASGVLVLVVLASVPYPWGLRMTGDVVARRIAITLEQGRDVTLALPITPARAEISGAGWIETPDGTRLRTDEARVTAARLSLAAIHLTSGSTLTVARSQAGPFLVQIGGGGSLEFEAAGSVTLGLDGAAPRILAQEGAVLLAAGSSATAAPMSLRLPGGAEGLVLDPVGITGLRFGEASGSEDEFVSTIVRGTLRLLDIDEKETLDRGSPLALTNFAGALVRLEGGAEGFHVWFTGRARHVALGPPGFAEDLTPSVLALLYHQQSLKLLWVAAGVVIAALLKVRSWLGDLRSR